MSDVNIYSEGPLTLSVCVVNGLTEAEVVRSVNEQRPCGTEHGWMASREGWRIDGKLTGNVGPIPCNQDSGRTHWLITA
jgi:hypothetical protein